MDKSLRHHGVIGMHWGVRRARNANNANNVSSLRRRLGLNDTANLLESSKKLHSATKKLFDDTKKINLRKKQKKSIADMSNEEIERRIQRMNLEKRYIELSDSELNSGIKTAKQVLSTVGIIITVAASGVALAKTIKGLGGN